MTQPVPGVHFVMSAAFALLAAAPAAAQPAGALVPYVDLESGFRISHPKAWRREIPAKGPVRVVLGEPRGAAGNAFTLCSVEHVVPDKPLALAQRQVDQELVKGFRTRDWPQQLAGKRKVLDFQVREVGGVPMGAVEWDGTETREGRQDFARGIKMYRMTPASLWTAECTVIGLTKPAAEAHFDRGLELISEILDSVRFPPDRP
jgi:hypothetical protein